MNFMKKNDRKRLLFKDYMLLEEIKNGKVSKIGDKIISSVGDFIPTIMLSFDKLIEKEFITDDCLITDKGSAYLEKYPYPKVKNPKLYDINEADIEYLKKLNDSKIDWTPSNKIAEKASMVFKIVRYGYAIAVKNRDGFKLSKDNVLPKVSIYMPNSRDRYYFKITKKGKDYLKSINK